jgi:hypothetical protein
LIFGDIRLGVTGEGENRMKVIAFNCSPKAEKANTALILNPFLKGLEKGGAQVELRNGHCAHALREGTKTGKVVLVSNCGFWEHDNFDPLLVHMRAFCRTIGRTFAGALLRPTGETFRGLLERQRPVADILEAAEEAGRQLIQEGDLSPETLEIISRELLSLDRFVSTSNNVCRRMLDALPE